MCQTVIAEYKGMEVLKSDLGLARKSLISTWSLLETIMHALLEFKPSNENFLKKALQSLHCMDA